MNPRAEQPVLRSPELPSPGQPPAVTTPVYYTGGTEYISHTLNKPFNVCVMTSIFIACWGKLFQTEWSPPVTRLRLELSVLWTVITSSHNLIDQLRHECLPHEYNYPPFWWSKLLVVRSIKQCAHCAQLNKMTSQCASILIASLSSMWHNITPSNFDHQNARWWYSWGKHSRHNWSIVSTGDMNAS